VNEREIFMAALDRETPEERNRYLDEACGDDREMRIQAPETPRCGEMEDRASSLAGWAFLPVVLCRAGTPNLHH
jgi:hypothetical protein